MIDHVTPLDDRLVVAAENCKVAPWSTVVALPAADTVRVGVFTVIVFVCDRPVSTVEVAFTVMTLALVSTPATLNTPVDELMVVPAL